MKDPLELARAVRLTRAYNSANRRYLDALSSSGPSNLGRDPTCQDLLMMADMAADLELMTEEVVAAQNRLAQLRRGKTNTS